MRSRSTRLQALIDDLVQREPTIHNAVLGVASGDGQFTWTGAAGAADPATGTPMRAETPFVIASVTKMYTAAAIMMLEERGALTLDDPVATHLPASLIHGLHRHRGTDYTHALTVRHLISQTSGFVDYFLERPRRGRSVFERLLTEGDREWTLEDVIELTKNEHPPAFPPATALSGNGPRARVRAHYSDTNFMLLGAIIESVTGAPLHAVFEELFFAPLHLTQTYLYGSPRASTLGEPARFFYKDRDLHIPKALSTHGPEGGIISTVGDTLRFGQAFMRGELFARATTLDVMQRQWNRIFFPLQYGYGLMRFTVPRILSPFGRPPELIGHSGSTGSFLFYYKELDLYLAGTVNQMARKRVPFRLMLQAIGLCKRARR